MTLLLVLPTRAGEPIPRYRMVDAGITNYDYMASGTMAGTQLADRISSPLTINNFQVIGGTAASSLGTPLFPFRWDRGQLDYLRGSTLVGLADNSNYVVTEKEPFGTTAGAGVDGIYTNFVGPRVVNGVMRPSAAIGISSDGRWFGANRNGALLWSPRTGEVPLDAPFSSASINCYPALVGNGYIWQYGQTRSLNDLFPSGGVWNLASLVTPQINARMDVAGVGYYQGVPHFFKASRNGIEELGVTALSLPWGISINNFGTVLIVSETNHFLAKDGLIIPLRSLVENLSDGVILHSVGNINDYGQIAAVASDGVTNRIVYLNPATMGTNIYPTPMNDAFNASAQLEGLEVTAVANNLAAGKEAGEPNHAGDPGGGSLWWRWTAPAATNVTLTTAGSSLDTLLAVYKGSSLGSLSLIASNDNYSPHHIFSQLNFDAEPGITYFIAVDGKLAPRGHNLGHIVLQLTTSPAFQNRPANDDLANAIPLLGFFQAAGSLVGASLEPFEEKGTKLGSVWYKWSATNDQTVTLMAKTNASAFVPAVQETRRGCNADPCPEYDSATKGIEDPADALRSVRRGKLFHFRGGFGIWKWRLLPILRPRQR